MRTTKSKPQLRLLNTYKLNKQVTKDTLKQNGFKGNTFKCYVYKDIVQLIITVDLVEKKWNYEIYDSDHDSVYTHYYVRQNENMVVKEIDKKVKLILKEMTRQNILERVK